VLGVLARRHGDFAAAEDAVQEALIAAAKQWPEQGVPQNPRGWLYHVAARRMTDHLRSEVARRRREDAVAQEVLAEWAFVPPPDVEIGAERDDTLALLLMCCHPALTPASAIALTLRAVGGLTTLEIARAFLVPEATMAQRISRAKQTIRQSNIPFRLPQDEEQAERIGTVLHVLYLVFNEGYVSSGGPDLQRPDLAVEAIRLTRTLHGLLPDNGEVAGLLALMLLTDARRAARTGPAGELIPLDEQDRTLWDRSQIVEGTTLVSRTLSRGTVGVYQLQAAIAALHDEAPSTRETDWPQILALYEVLRESSDNPVVRLNHAIAAAMVQGPETGLRLLAALDDDSRIAGHYRLDAVRGHLHEMAGNSDQALKHYRAAAERTASLPERNYLLSKAADLSIHLRSALRDWRIPILAAMVWTASCARPTPSPIFPESLYQTRLDQPDRAPPPGWAILDEAARAARIPVLGSVALPEGARELRLTSAASGMIWQPVPELRLLESKDGVVGELYLYWFRIRDSVGREMMPGWVRQRRWGCEVVRQTATMASCRIRPQDGTSWRAVADSLGALNVWDLPPRGMEERIGSHISDQEGILGELLIGTEYRRFRYYDLERLSGSDVPRIRRAAQLVENLLPRQ
jgi:RNA polymerase sigma factor (sigma-70 family)